MQLSLIYTQQNDLGAPWLSRLHPFEGCKYTKAWKQVLAQRAPQVQQCLVDIPQPLPWKELLAVHTPEYLANLKHRSVIIEALEMPLLRLLPQRLIERHILRPMLFACMGTRLAAEAALDHGGLAFHLGGGFHHAHRDHGEGFCLFADIPLAIRHLQHRGRLKPANQILIIDLDAHRGNGFESICQDWPVEFLDLYNFQVYPGLKDDEPDRFPFLVPMKQGENGNDYMATLHDELPKFLEANPTAKLVLYNAGTDILDGDPLGKLAVEASAVLDRDRFVLAALRERHLPTVVCTSGGYTARSADLIAQTVLHLLNVAETA